MTRLVSNPFILYDGVCGLCNRFNQFVLKRDEQEIFRFASLQTCLAQKILARYSVRTTDIATLYVVIDYELASERLFRKSEAVFFILRQLRGVWSLAASGSMFPRVVTDYGYDLIAHNRYRIFGNHLCPLPAAGYRAKFFDV